MNPEELAKHVTVNIDSNTALQIANQYLYFKYVELFVLTILLVLLGIGIGKGIKFLTKELG